MKAEHVDIKAAFLEVLEKGTPEERRAYLAHVCQANPELRAEFESLLTAYDEAGDFLQAPPFGSGVELDIPPVAEGPGTTIGRYKLLEKIGEGGMAVVYMAEQQEPIRRKVALKIIKLGMDTRQVIARFEAERQALALMDHPSIAKVLDAGATDTGRPYFVMELVTGVSITEYCDKNSLSTKDRLALFLQVCHAVQHAHQKGIIHRDLKPSNVMVTHHDGQPIPKVIDFGIAKATVGANNYSPVLTEKTLFTRYAHLIGTPAYMSPEQAELSDLDIDTRSDIYSLGVLLYELLTGTTPFSEEELRKAGYIEMQRVIREQEPMKPSTRIKTALRRASVPLAAKTSCGDARPTKKAGPRWPCDWDPKRDRSRLGTHSMGGTPMLREVRGDLDWIVMKSLEKDRARRYETASGLAEDVRRHLEHEPILARGPGTTYRLHKFLRRHRWQTTATLATVVVAGAAVVLLSLWNRDRLQLAEAEGFRDRGILSQAREQYAKADRAAALETIKPILQSQHVGPEAQLLQAGILVDNRRSKEAVTVLESLLRERPEVAGAAHALLARLLWESESLDAEKLKEFEEHRRQAEALLPETAEAYFLRAMTALTIKEQLTALNKALELDPEHYESLRLRAFTHYASRKYEKMKDDALGMIYLRRHDRLGHSLRAMALRELGAYEEAVAEYDQALALAPKGDPQYIDLAVKRCETFLRMGDYERVMAEARERLKLRPEEPVFSYYLFGALTALGDYEKANTVFAEIVRRTPTARNEFQYWSMKYVFDTLAVGRSWHLPGREPVGPAFLAMVEAEEIRDQLCAKGRRLTTDGFSAHWSPDGKKLAFSLGVHGRSGVAVFDPTTKETELLIVPGKDPRWSPDGKYIAFVRDCQALRLEEFATPEQGSKDRSVMNEEVWLMNADGTEPRRLARGGWPSWSRDSTCIYYQSRVDKTLCLISIEGQDAKPKQIMACSCESPAISPDEKHVAYLGSASLIVRDLVSQSLVAEWDVPFPTSGAAAWSPAGGELCMAGRNNNEDRTGLWIYRLDRNESAKTLGGQITAASWAPDGTKLVICLGQPYGEVWVSDLDSSVSTIEALGPGRTVEEHLREMVALYSRRIEADAQDAYAHSNRAQYYDYLHDREKARAGMRLFSVILNRGVPPDARIAPPRRFRGAINGPYRYQLAFSVGRRDNRIAVLCVACGQKGRCEMEVFEVPMLTMSLLALGLFSGLDAPPALGDLTFGEPVNLGPAINTPMQEASAAIGPDGLSLFFWRGATWEDVGTAWLASRARKQDPWDGPVSLGAWGSPSSYKSVTVWPSLTTSDGLELYCSDSSVDPQTLRPGGYGGIDLWVMKRETTDAPWGAPTNLGPLVNSSGHDFMPYVSADGLELFFASSRPGGYGSADLWATRRATRKDPWGVPVNLGPLVNSAAHDARPWLSPDGLLLLFDSDRAGGYGGADLYMARRADRTSPWGLPVNLGPLVNSPAWEECAYMSADGSTLFFDSERPGTHGGADIWQAPVMPIVDFNADKKVDLVDLVILIDNWGTNKSLCDIGPMPWGDGKVDIEDLKVFMTYFEKENPPVKP